MFFDDFIKSRQLSNDETGVINSLVSSSNLMFSFAKLTQEQFIERKILFKIIPNFFKYLCQSQKYIIKKIDMVISNITAFYDRERIKEQLIQFKASFNKFYTFFEDNFFRSIDKIIEEKGVFFEEKSVNELKESLEKFRVKFIENFSMKKEEIEKV